MTEPKSESARLRNRLRDHEKQHAWLRLISVLHIAYGGLLLVLVPIIVAIWSGEFSGAYAVSLAKAGYPPALGGAVFFLWIAVGVLHIASGRALQEELPRGRWMASIASVWMLSGGLFRIANATEDSLDILLFIVFPLLSLFVVNVVAVDYLKPTADSRQLTADS